MAQKVYDPETGEMIDKYDLYFKQKRAKQLAAESGVEDLSGPVPGEVQDLSGDIPPSYKQSQPVAGKGAAGGMAGVQQSMASGGDGADMLGSGLTGAGMATANPYLVGAGLGVTAISSINKAKNQREQQRYQAELQKYQARQAAIQRMAEIGKNLKA